MLSTPFVDLGPSCRPLNEAILADVAELLDSGRFHYGPQVVEFEERFAAYCGVRAVRGDVQRPRCAATGAARGRDRARRRGDRPREHVHSDLRRSAAGGRSTGARGRERRGLQPRSRSARGGGQRRERASSFLSTSTGNRRTCGASSEVADARGLQVIEDACQAHGASRDGPRAGTAGIAAASASTPARTSAPAATRVRS